MNRHRSIVGGLHVAFGMLAVLPLVILTAIFGGIWGVVAIGSHGHPNGDQASLILGLGLGTVLAIVAISSALVGAVSVVAGIGVWRGERWADLLALVVSAVQLFNPPVGTALAVYTGWVLLVREPAGVRALPRRVWSPQPSL